MRKKLRATAAAIIFVAIAGCSAPTSTTPAPSASPATPLAPDPAPTPSTEAPLATAPEAQPFPLEYTPELLSAALISGQPTYRRDGESKDYWPTLESKSWPESHPADVNETLKQVAARLQAGEKPDAAESPSAKFVATLAGETHLYNLGKEYPNAEADYLLFILRHGDQGWVQSRICQYRSNWVAVYGLASGEPLLFCGTTTGNGRPHRFVSIYRGTTEILHLDRLEAKDGGFELLASEGDGPPPVRVVHYNDWFGYGRTSDWIMERVTLTWDGSQYVASRREWLDDWAYHFARFDSLLGAGDLKRAAGELAFSPANGLQAYLETHAPGLQMNSHKWAWPRWNAEKTRFYVMAITEAGGDAKKAPWYWFEFTPEGLIAAIGKQSGPPPQG